MVILTTLSLDFHISNLLLLGLTLHLIIVYICELAKAKAPVCLYISLNKLSQHNYHYIDLNFKLHFKNKSSSR